MRARRSPKVPRCRSAGSARLQGIKLPRLGVLTAACQVGYYAAAVGFHVRADDHPLVWLPAIAFGATAAASLVAFSVAASSGAS